MSKFRRLLLMIRQQWGWAVLTALCAVGCGGQAEGSDTVSQTPPSGFYSVSWQTVSDSCQPLQPEVMTSELAMATADGANVVTWQYGKRRQDLTWDKPLEFTWSECGATISLKVTATSAHSLVVDHQMAWVNPAACDPLDWFDVPSADCAVHQIATYELEEPCPATRSGFNCW
jgi:hypothetical protein